MAAFTSQLVVAVWILALCSEARVLSKPCIRGELVAVVNSSRLFGFPVECHDVCEVWTVSPSSVAACNRGMSEETGWTRCGASTPDAIVLQDSEKEHLCILATQVKYIHGGSSCIDKFINEECHSGKESSLRPRRSAEIVDSKTHPRGQNFHSWAIVISSVVTLILLVLVSVLCVGSNKNVTEPTSKAPANSATQDSIIAVKNHHDSTNQTNQNERANVNGGAKVGDQGQHLYVNVQLEASSKPDRDAGSQSPDENQDQQQPVNTDQEQPVANQGEQLADQNVELQAAELVQDQPQQAADQPQAPQAAANGDVVGQQQQQDAEKTKIPYGVVTIHSDQSNTPADNNNYAVVRSEEDEATQDTMYDRVNYDVINDSSRVNENGYSTVKRDQPAQPEQPRRDRMYESVDEAFNKETKTSAPVVDGDNEGLEQDDMYEKVPDTFRKKVASLSQVEAPKLPPMNLRSRKQNDDITAVQQQRSSSAATLPLGGPPSSPLVQYRGRLQSSPAIKPPPAPSFPAPSIPPPTFRAPSPPPDNEDIEDDENALYARPEPTGGRSMSSSMVREKMNLEEARRKSSTLPVKVKHPLGGPRSPVTLGPLPALPESNKVSSSNQPKEDEEETEDPGYDTTQSVMANPDYDRLEPAGEQDGGQEVGQQQQQQPEQQQQEEPLTSPKSPSSVKHDGKGYALPSTKKAEENYATVNLTQKRMSQRKKKQTTGDGGNTAVTRESPIPPSPPPLDPELVDEDMKTEPSVPPRLPQSEELVEATKVEPPYAKVNKLVEPTKVEPPYAKVNKGKISDSEQPSGTEETGGDDEIDPYAAVDIQVLGGVPVMQVTTEREYESIDNVMSPSSQQPPVNVVLSDMAGEYACVRSDATISPIPTHPMPDPSTGSVATAHDTPANDATAQEQTPEDEHLANSSPERTEL